MDVSVLPAHVYLALCECSGYRGWKRVLQPRGRELWRAVNHSALGKPILGPLQEPQMLWTAEPSLQPLKLFSALKKR